MKTHRNNYIILFILTKTRHSLRVFFFFNDPATPEISPLPLHAALPILLHRLGHVPGLVRDGLQGGAGQVRAGMEAGQADDRSARVSPPVRREQPGEGRHEVDAVGDRKSTRLNSSHGYISYAGFCLKNKIGCLTRCDSAPAGTKIAGSTTSPAPHTDSAPSDRDDDPPRAAPRPAPHGQPAVPRPTCW